MLESHINFKRTSYDFVFTLILTAILYILLMKAVNLKPISDISFPIVLAVLFNRHNNFNCSLVIMPEQYLFLEIRVLASRRYNLLYNSKK